MKITIDHDKQASRATLTISVPKDELQPFFKKAANELSKEYKLKGFRPGKAPVDQVVKALGEDPVVLGQ